MTAIIEQIPEGIETSFLKEIESGDLPAIRKIGVVVRIPVLVRKIHDPETGRNTYHYYEVDVPYTGQDITDYGKCLIASYAAIRKVFYGPWEVQNEQIYKGSFEAHQEAVRQTFPKAAAANAN